MKYVMVIDNYDEESPILFPECITHRDVAGFSRLKVVSAGFCMKADGQWQASGRSESLRVDSRTQDSEIIQRYFK